MKHILVLHPVSESTLRRMHDACERRGWRLSIITIGSSTVGDGMQMYRWLRVPDLNDDPIDLRRSAQALEHPIDAVVAGNEFAVVAADVLAKELGLAGTDPQKIRASRDKRLMRQAFEMAGVPQPKVICTLSSIEEAHALNAQEINFPVIVKPVDMAMSLFVKLCASQQEVIENLERMFQFKKSRLTNYAFTSQAIVEEFASGQEYSLECVVEDGDVIAMYPTQKFVSDLPSFFETGHMNAELDSDELTESCRSAASRVAASWGLDAGVLHVELKISDAGVKVIEAGCRIAGDHISELVEKRYGVSLEEVLLCQRAGLRVHDLISVPVRDAYYGIKFLFPQTQQLHPHSHSAVREVECHFSPEQAVHGDLWSVNQRLGYCICASQDVAELCGFIASF